MSEAVKSCRHCGAEPARRPRGLGWKCYYTPGVKEQYPPVSLRGNRGVGNDSSRRPTTPTTARPGTAEKLAVLIARAEAGEELFHPLDPRTMNGDGQPLPRVLVNNPVRKSPERDATIRAFTGSLRDAAERFGMTVKSVKHVRRGFVNGKKVAG